jgi:serine/threonine protein kinase
MLSQGMVLQGRYRILRQIGGGGMGVVFLAEDTRLPGRKCAVKEMSPAQLAPQDRNWAIAAFRQEAQMLAGLNHPGLTAVTDFLPEGGNWYLVMDHVEGETLKDRLERARGGRLPLEEALNIVRQLCNVLEYLHGRDPPVVFRDLKPGNVMITPQGEVKLIDFGIARFFKPGQTRDTINLGTPGYAAPEQFGGLGQSDPRTDVYSLGALLLHMVTGYDPITAATPFPLPSPESLTRDLPACVEQVISRATRMQPDLRFSSMRELREALFPPTRILPLSPQPTPTPRWVWIGLGIAGVLLAGLCAAVLSGALVLPAITEDKDGITPTIPHPTTPPPATSGPPPTTPVDSPPPPPAQPQPTSSPYVRATVDTSLHWDTIGQSVRGRDLSVARIGYEDETIVVVVGSIQGDQMNTRDLVNALISYFDQNSQQIPAGTAFYFMPSLNPDGNANGVDLNRNWDTADWRSNPAVPGYPNGKSGAGGSRPFSEPETCALRDLLLQLQPQVTNLRVVILHSSVRRSQGELYPGGDAAVGIANAYAAVTGYDIETAWAEYTTSGELVTWCEEEDILSIDVVIPGSQSPSTRVSGSRTLLDITVEALLEIVDYP